LGIPIFNAATGPCSLTIYNPLIKSIPLDLFQIPDGGEESQPAEQESGDVTAAPTTEQPAEESKPQEGEGLDIEAMIAALHSDSATANSESININL
jgi:hypothetical protein